MESNIAHKADRPKITLHVKPNIILNVTPKTRPKIILNFKPNIILHVNEPDELADSVGKDLYLLDVKKRHTAFDSPKVRIEGSELDYEVARYAIPTVEKARRDRSRQVRQRLTPENLAFHNQQIEAEAEKFFDQSSSRTEAWTQGVSFGTQEADVVAAAAARRQCMIVDMGKRLSVLRRRHRIADEKLTFDNKNKRERGMDYGNDKASHKRRRSPSSDPTDDDSSSSSDSDNDRDSDGSGGLRKPQGRTLTETAAQASTKMLMRAMEAKRPRLGEGHLTRWCANVGNAGAAGLAGKTPREGL